MAVSWLLSPKVVLNCWFSMEEEANDQLLVCTSVDRINKVDTDDVDVVKFDDDDDDDGGGNDDDDDDDDDKHSSLL